MPVNTPSVRVVVRLPWDRSEGAEPDPPHIEWTSEKADILWRVIEKSRSSDSGGADWKGLAAHLEVPLPYLLYRVNARFQQDIRGLKDIQGALSPSPAIATNPKFESTTQVERPSLIIRTGVSSSGTSTSNPTPRNVRVRLNSLVSNAQRPRKAASSSTLTVQDLRRQSVPLCPQSPLSEGSDNLSEDDEAALKEEEAERKAEEQEALNLKLEQLSRLITNDTLGIIRSKRNIERGNGGTSPISPNSNSATNSFRGDSLSSRSDNQSLSSTSSPQCSIADIPSPTTDSQPHSPMHFGHRASNTNSVSPVPVSSRGAMSYSHNRRYSQLTGDHGSGHSETSSFSDLSAIDESLSTSALESALMSNTTNIRSTPGTSRLFVHPASRNRTSNSTLRPL